MALLPSWLVTLIFSLVLGSLTAFANTSSLSIAAFNIKTLGKTKIKNQEVVQHLVEIMEQYDIIFVQEIRDIQERVAFQLLRVLKQQNPRYELLLSPQLGRSSQKESYGFYYRSDKTNIQHWYLYADPEDIFERDPIITTFSWQGGVFSIVGIHTKPKHATQEILALKDVIAGLPQDRSYQNALLMGDLNADCRYYNPGRHGFDFFNQPVRILIQDFEDTTVNSSTHCAYDRILAFGTVMNHIQSSDVFEFDVFLDLSEEDALKISDHYPVAIELKSPSSN